jgi:hypothetical protein
MDYRHHQLFLAWMIMSGELERVGEEAIMTSFKVLFRISSGGTEENHNKIWE